MKPDIIAKLSNELAEPIVSERQVVYILVELRKLIELNDDGDTFKTLKFYCDWAVHAVLKAPPAQEIVRYFDKYQQFNEEMNNAARGRALAADINFLNELGEIIR